MIFALLSVHALVPWEIEEVFFEPYQQLRYYDEVRYAGGTWRAEVIDDYRQYGMRGNFSQLKFNGIKIHDNLELMEDGNAADHPHDTGFVRSPDGKIFFVERTHSSAGHGEWTHFFELRSGGRVKKIFSDESESGGPIFRDFDNDGKFEWVFDDYGWYDYYGDPPNWIYVYKPTKSGLLKLWKKMPNRRKIYVNRLVVPEWDSSGRQNLIYVERGR